MEVNQTASDQETVNAIVASSRALAGALERNPSLLANPDQLESLPNRLKAALIAIAGDDLTGRIDMEEATARYSDAIDRLVADALKMAIESVAEKHPTALALPFAVVAMGKWGARELNYYSDIDLIIRARAGGRRTGQRPSRRPGNRQQTGCNPLIAHV